MIHKVKEKKKAVKLSNFNEGPDMDGNHMHEGFYVETTTITLELIQTPPVAPAN